MSPKLFKTLIIYLGITFKFEGKTDMKVLKRITCCTLFLGNLEYVVYQIEKYIKKGDMTDAGG